MPEQHAKLSASGSPRWLNCTPSIRMEKGLPNSTSVFAEEGTLAHELGEISLRLNLEEIESKEFNKGLKKLMKSKLWSADMPEYVDKYILTCMEKVGEALDKDSMSEFKVEHRLDFSEWVPEGFGTGDFVIISGNTIEVCDLKYGKGIQVSAVNNSQMMLYALGAISEFDFIYEIEKVKMTIIQPRLDSISEWEISKTDLLDWANNTVKPKAEMAIKGEGDFVAGEHCTFCKAKATCRARADKNLEIAKYDFRCSDTLETTEIADILGRLDELTKWATDVKEYALYEALEKDVTYPGWKLVEGRSNRKYTDVVKIEEILSNNDYLEIFKPKELLGITAMEKVVGKARLTELIGSYIEKPYGKPVLVVETDKRPQFNPAKADFNKINESEE